MKKNNSIEQNFEENVGLVEVAELASKLRERSAADHAVNMVKVLLNAVPVAGGSFASLIDDYIPKQKEERLIDFTVKLSQALTLVANRVDRNFIKSDQFSFLFEQCYRGVAERYHEKTLSALCGVLVNSLIRFDVEQEVKEEFIRIASMLRPPHLYVLEFFAEPSNRERYPYQGPEGGIRGHRDQVAAVINAYCIPDAEKDLIVAILSLLQANGLITNPYNVEHRSVHELTRCVTPLGKSFLEFIKEPQNFGEAENVPFGDSSHSTNQG